MIKGIGVDILEIKRIEKYLDTDQFINKILTTAEISQFKSLNKKQKEYLAGRYAAKEAYSKACGTGIGKLAFKDIEILNNELGQPYLTNDPKAHVSISHEKDYVVAFVVIGE